MMPTCDIIVGHVLTELRKLPAGRFRCCVTSPPYFGLRSYGTEPQIWGGRADCAHDWTDNGKTREHFDRSTGAHDANGSGMFVDKRGEQDSKIARGEVRSNGATCATCAAWRGELGSEPTLDLFIAHIVEVFREVRRTLSDDGTAWVNFGDSYANDGKWGGHTGGKHVKALHCSPIGRNKRYTGFKSKDLMMVPARIALALQADGWYLRSMIPWIKRNCMPESVNGSHFTRHMVTVADYERLSGLQYTDERVGDAWAGDMPDLSEIKIPKGKTPLSAKREGQISGQSEGGTRRREGEAPPIQSLASGQKEQSEIRGDREGSPHKSQVDGEISTESEGEAGAAPISSAHERIGATETSTTPSESQISQDWQREGDGDAPTRETPRGDLELGGYADGSPVARDNQGIERSMLPLQEKEETDGRSCDSVEQGRSTHADKCGPGVRSVQFAEEQQDSVPLLVGCPGCKKCSKHHGYIFCLSAGRPTSATEYIFLFSKNQDYFYDKTPTMILASKNSHARMAQNVEAQNGTTRANGGAKTNGNLKAVCSKVAKNEESGLRRYEGFNERWDAKERKLAESGSGVKNNDSMDAALANVVLARNRRNSDWLIESWQGLLADEDGDPLAFIVNPQPYREAHFATFPPRLVQPMIMAGSTAGDHVLDPFFGSGTTGEVAIGLGRNCTGIELNPAYAELARTRTNVTGGLPLT